MMKKVLLSIFLTLLPLLASAEAVEIDGIWYNIIEKGNVAEVTNNPSGNNYSGGISIPKIIKYNNVEYIVSKIGGGAFYCCSGLSSVNIPNSVTSIDDFAFYGCCGLTSLIIPNSVTSTGSYVFAGCSGLSSVTIPSSLTYISDSAFKECINLTSVDIPNSVTLIGNHAFSCCYNLLSVTIPNSVVTIGIYAFENCNLLTNFSIPKNIISIGRYAFINCISLTSITIPSGSIEVFAFSGCTRLSSVTIGGDVRTIDSGAFSNCSILKDVYCLAEAIKTNVLSKGIYASADAFKDSYIEYTTLHVPASSIEAYRSMGPWSQFKAIVPLEDGDNPETQKCATPEISYSNGKLDFTCETEGVEFVSEVTTEDVKKYYDASVALTQTYKVTVYATKAGYENSEVATREIVIEKGQTTLFGDLDKDGKVNVADHVKLSDIIMNK